jgi:hypothetical protein
MDVQIQNLTSDVYLLSALTPEFLEQVAARVEELIAARQEQERDRHEDMRIEQHALELD